MAQWIILWKNDLDYPCAMPEDDGKGFQSYDSLVDVRKAWADYGMSNYFTAYALDLESGSTAEL